MILQEQILKVLEVNASYGHRRIALALGVGKKRVRRVMKLFGIKPYKRKARWTKKRDQGNPPSKFPNLIKGSCPIKPRIYFAGDFTRLAWNGKIIYLATFIDSFTREIVGWSISTRHTKEASTTQKVTPTSWKIWKLKSVCLPKPVPGRMPTKKVFTTTLRRT